MKLNSFENMDTSFTFLGKLEKESESSKSTLSICHVEIHLTQTPNCDVPQHFIAVLYFPTGTLNYFGNSGKISTSSFLNI